MLNPAPASSAGAPIYDDSLESKNPANPSGRSARQRSAYKQSASSRRGTELPGDRGCTAHALLGLWVFTFRGSSQRSTDSVDLD